MQIELFLKELEAEAVTTRKMLALVPMDKLDWQPHPKSMTIRALAGHVAEIPGWVHYAILFDEVDVANPDFKVPKFETTAELLSLFENNQKQSMDTLKAADESTFDKIWQLKYGDQVLSSWTKAETIRHSISQIIHHRAQLGVFLRLLDIPIPGSYGPSADEMGK